jgi:hypothetical protein
VADRYAFTLSASIFLIAVSRYFALMDFVLQVLSRFTPWLGQAYVLTSVFILPPRLESPLMDEPQDLHTTKPVRKYSGLAFWCGRQDFLLFRIAWTLSNCALVMMAGIAVSLRTSSNLSISTRFALRLPPSRL